MAIRMLAASPFGLTAGGCPTTVNDLAKKYDEVFPSGNRNAASHRWATHILGCAGELTAAQFVDLFTGFCPVSGSPTSGTDVQRHRYPGAESSWGQLNFLQGTGSGGALYHCCEPCICDAVDFIAVDTKQVGVGGQTAEYSFVVIGNPCASSPPLDADGRLDVPIFDPFANASSTLAKEAPDVVCDGTELQAATLSDHGHVIIGLYHDDGSGGGKSISDAQSFCEAREDTGFASGMGAIFREVANITRIAGASSSSAEQQKWNATARHAARSAPQPGRREESAVAARVAVLMG